MMQHKGITGVPIATSARDGFESRMRRITARNLRAASMKVTEMNPNMARWYCLVVKRGREFDVENLLKEANVEAFMPRERVVFVRHGRKVEGDRPGLPGYVLVRFVPSNEAFAGMVNLKNVFDFVGGASGYHIIKDAHVDVFKRISNGEDVTRIATDKTIGDGSKAEIVMGPFAGFDCVVTSVKWCRQAKASVRIHVEGRAFDIDSMPLAFLKKL
ncbi:transcription termination/antitermination protein NusG [Sinorhizobium fredii]|uniref:transcription termination/antitermination protein NusG n=1 Tax=Rhizobium fredii TaxID=380 RepID=UPI001FCB1531|nr:transcription termination/antitermination NusG family protein [Sinorhizobium fredii]